MLASEGSGLDSCNLTCGCRLLGANGMCLPAPIPLGAVVSQFTL